MKDKVKIILLLFTMISISAMAQEKRHLAMDEAIDMSIKNSRQLKMSQAKVEEATASLTEALQKKLPDAGVSGAYMRLSSANIDLKNPNSNGGGSPKVSQALYGIFNVSLPIYTGGRIKYGIESSRLLAQAVKLDAEKNREEVIVNTVASYINLYKSKAAVDMVHENLLQAQQRVKDFSNLEKNGLLARNDLLKAELQASNTELSLLEVENNWQLANVNMNLLLGLPESTLLEPDSSILAQKFTAAPLDDYLKAALNRKDLESSDLRKQAAATGVKASKGEYYPSVQLTGGYIAADIPKVLTVTNAVNIGVGISYNVASLWKTKAKVQGAEARANQLSAAQEMLFDNIRLEVNRAYLNWLNSQKKIEVVAKAEEQATENLRIIKNKYNNSLATATDLLEADVAALQARLNYLFAKADAVVAYSQLLETAGEAGNGIK